MPGLGEFLLPAKRFMTGMSRFLLPAKRFMTVNSQFSLPLTVDFTRKNPKFAPHKRRSLGL